MIEIKAVNNKDFGDLPDILFKPIVDGKEINSLGETEDIAYLIGLEKKYLGDNSQFVKFACKMLEIKSAWTV